MSQLAVAKHEDDEESAHGKLAPVDQVFNGTRFMGLIVATLAVAIAIIYLCASYNPDNGRFDLSWQGWGIAHDPMEHSLESSQANLEFNPF